MVTRLLHGHRAFLKNYARSERTYLKRLAEDGQAPAAMYIGCSDSRVIPELLTRTKPGELFVVRNVANVVPIQGDTATSVGAALEFAVGVLGVRDVIVCGHDQCGGVKSIFEGVQTVSHLPSLADWLKRVEPATIAAKEAGAGFDLERQLRFAVEENVLLQLENLATYPVVQAALAEERIALHGWVYDLHSSHVRVFDHEEVAFLSVEELV